MPKTQIFERILREQLDLVPPIIKPLQPSVIGAAFLPVRIYGFDLALGAGKLLSNLPVATDWAVTLYPWAPGAGAGAVVRPFSGTVTGLVPVFAGDGAGGVTDTMTVTTIYDEDDGTWNIDFDDNGTDDQVVQLAMSQFESIGTLFEVGNTFLITDPTDGIGTWQLNEWSTINPDNQEQGLNPITPVPEPASLGLLVLGGLMIFRRNRRD